MQDYPLNISGAPDALSYVPPKAMAEVGELGFTGKGNTAPRLSENTDGVSPSENPLPTRGLGKACLTTLTAMALTLPGLALSPALASAVSTGYSLDPLEGATQEVGAQIYVVTGASRVSGVMASTPSSVKRYRITCFDDGSGAPSLAKVKIRGRTKAAKYKVKATLESNGEQQVAIDAKNGDIGFSNYATVRQGTSDYILTISKVKKKPKDSNKKLKGTLVFETRQECDTASGAYAGIKKPVPIP